MEINDVALVSQSVAGDRDAFALIVERYQSLVCSLAYSATGSLGRSEELAQETFVVAWQRMADLREPEKLRSWLCGIVRRLTGKALRSESREPSHSAIPLDSLTETPVDEPSPPDRTISREEEAILWQSLERVPENYREPLVLFYREHQSVGNVATALDLSEDAVKQRLSRGRKLLQQEVLSIIEGVLSQTKPGRAFTFGVIAALPAFATSASAATIAAAAAKGSATASSASILSVFTSLLGPLLGILGAWVGIRAGLKSTRTPRERQYMIRQTKLMIAVMVGFNLLIIGWVLAGFNGLSRHPLAYALSGVIVILFSAGFIAISAFRNSRRFRELREEEKKAHPEAYAGEDQPSWDKLHEYRSRFSFLGLPLVHIRSGANPGEKTRPAVGWIALGDRAYGILFAAGGLAVGGVAMGGAAVGVIAAGGASLGLLFGIGGLAIGGFALGGAAIGIVAFGGLAMAWLGAEGGLAIARGFAIGGQAMAEQANNDAAREFFAPYRWMDLTRSEVRNWFMLICWSPMLLVAWQALRMREKRLRSLPSTHDRKRNDPS